MNFEKEFNLDNYYDYSWLMSSVKSNNRYHESGLLPTLSSFLFSLSWNVNSARLDTSQNPITSLGPTRYTKKKQNK